MEKHGKRTIIILLGLLGGLIGIDFLCEDEMYEVIIVGSPQIIIGRNW